MNELVELEKKNWRVQVSANGRCGGRNHCYALAIIWQRLVTAEGKTCDRCAATYQEMQRAVSKLKESLRPLGSAPTLETRVIDEESFKANPSASNRMSIADRPLEEWLGARIGVVNAVLSVGTPNVGRLR